MKLLFISLGCDKNLVDSEMMMGLCMTEVMNLQTMKKKQILL